MHTEEGTASTSQPLVQAVAATPATSSTSASSTPAVSKPAAAKRRAELDEWRRMLADPAYRKAMLAQHRLQLESQYSELAAELGLSQDEADRFLDLLAEQSLRESKYDMKDDLGPNNENWEERRRRLKERHEQAENERKALLGEERFRTWTEYVNSAGAARRSGNCAQSSQRRAPRYARIRSSRRQRERARAEFELWRASLEAEKKRKAAAGSR